MSMYAHPMLRQEAEAEATAEEGLWSPNPDYTDPVGVHDFIQEDKRFPHKDEAEICW